LQIASDKTFATSSLVLDKSGLDGDSYTLTAVDLQKLTSTEIPYYWRIESIDAASNESGWTGASLFYLSTPFKFPKWGIYVGAVVGALVFFLIGLMVGRRTAFMY
jgi:hypothetical protein